MLAMCGRARGRSGIANITATCWAHDGRLRAAYHMNFRLDNGSAHTASNMANSVAKLLGGAAPHAVLLDGWQWALQLQQVFESGVLANTLRADFVAHLQRGRPLPLGIVEEFARAWARGASDFLGAVRRAFDTLASRHGSPPPSLVWVTTQRSMPPARQMQMGSAAPRLPSGPSHCDADARCAKMAFFAASYREPARSSQGHAQATVCCRLWLDPAVSAIFNARGRDVARAHGLLVLDAERMLLPQAPEAYLWDANHLRHRYSVALVNVLLHALAYAGAVHAPNATSTLPPRDERATLHG